MAGAHRGDGAAAGEDDRRRPRQRSRARPARAHRPVHLQRDDARGCSASRCRSAPDAAPCPQDEGFNMKTLPHFTLRGGRFARTLAAASIAAVLLFGCGGVGTGGTGAFVSSDITGFASVIVGGVEFDDTRASVLDDDGVPVARSSTELRLGVMVEVDGSTIVNTASGKTATAATIRIATTVLGPVESIDTGMRTLTVLGQQLQINAATVFGPSLHGGLSALHAGDVVAAYALPDAISGRYVATRIEPAHGASAYRLRGVVSALDTTAHTLRIGGATLNYANASGAPADLANGQLVRVRLPATSGVGTLNVDAFGPAIARPADGDAAVVEGLVTSFNSASTFAVNGMPVDASHEIGRAHV